MRYKFLFLSVLSLAAGAADGTAPADLAPVSAQVIELGTGPLHQTTFSGRVDRAKTINLSFEHLGRIVSTESIGVRTKPCFLDKNMTVVQPGDALAVQDSRVYEYQVHIDKANVKSAEAALEEARQQHERAQQLFEKKALSQKEMDRTLKEYEMAKAKLLSSEASLAKSLYDLDVCTLRAPFSGQVEELYYNLGTCVDKGKDVLKYSVISLVKVTVPVPESVSRHIGKTDVIYVYPADGSEPRGCLLYQDEVLDPFILNIYAGNTEVPVKGGLTPEEEKLPKVGHIAWVAKNDESDPADPAWAPVKAIFQDSDGKYFVWRAAGQKIAVKGKAIDRIVTAEKCYVEPEDIFRTIGLLKYQRLKKWGNLDTFDVLLLSARPETIKDKGKVVYEERRWLFRPGETVKVRIPQLAPEGLYVPMDAAYHSPDRKNWWVYVLDGNGKARRADITVRDSFDRMLRIEGPMIKAGVKVVLPEEKADITDGTPVTVSAVLKSPLLRMSKKDIDDALKKIDAQKKN
jgi:RND family efflux transporter MFP subunit